MSIRTLVTVVIASSVLVSLSQAQDSVPTTKTKIDISAQELSSALQEFAQERKLYLIYAQGDVANHRTSGASGELTRDEALNRLLRGTGLTYRFLDERTITIVPVDASVRSAAKLDSEGRYARTSQDCSGLSTDERDSSTAMNEDGSESAPVDRVGVETANRCKQQNKQDNLALVRAEGVQPVQPNAGESSLNSDLTGTKGIQEIVVTAQKREQRLQDIPLSVTALDEQLLVKTGAVDLIDYATRVPNLSFGATGGSSPLSLYTMQIRGVAGAGTTGFYIDDVPLPEGMNPRVMDISRIEVLRGPQGSLYGARSMGGTVRLITKRADPTATEFKTHASLGAVAEGDLDYAADSAFNMPISSKLAFRGNAYYQRQTGVHDIVVDNPNVAGDEITHKNADEGEYWGLQALVTWEPTEHLTVEPRFMYQNSHLDWVPYSDLRPGNFTARRVIDRADPNEEEWSISSLTVSQDTDWGRFTSATAFLNQENNGSEEWSEFMNFFSGAVGGDPSYYPPGGSLLTANTKDRRITEEARFTSEFDGRLQLTAGVFYSKNKQDILAPCSFAVGFGEAIGDPSLTDCIYSLDARVETEEAAVFGEFEYAILDEWH